MNKTAFTLAEVLITLGIIGIVAAMTLPTIIQKQYQKEASSRLKNFIVQCRRPFYYLRLTTAL